MTKRRNNTIRKPKQGRPTLPIETLRSMEQYKQDVLAVRWAGFRDGYEILARVLAEQKGIHVIPVDEFILTYGVTYQDNSDGTK